MIRQIILAVFILAKRYAVQWDIRIDSYDKWEWQEPIVAQILRILMRTWSYNTELSKIIKFHWPYKELFIG